MKDLLYLKDLHELIEGEDARLWVLLGDGLMKEGKTIY